MKEDPQTGKTYLNIPVPDKDSVQKALTLLSTLFPQKVTIRNKPSGWG